MKKTKILSLLVAILVILLTSCASNSNVIACSELNGYKLKDYIYKESYQRLDDVIYNNYEVVPSVITYDFNKLDTSKVVKYILDKRALKLYEYDSLNKEITASEPADVLYVTSLNYNYESKVLYINNIYFINYTSQVTFKGVKR